MATATSIPTPSAPSTYKPRARDFEIGMRLADREDQSIYQVVGYWNQTVALLPDQPRARGELMLASAEEIVELFEIAMCEPCGLPEHMCHILH